MKKKIIKSLKKYQVGGGQKSSFVKSTNGEGDKDYTSIFGNLYKTIVKTSTPQGIRYYSGESPDYNLSSSIARSNARRQGPDSTRRATLSKDQLEGLGEKKNGRICKN